MTLKPCSQITKFSSIFSTEIRPDIVEVYHCANGVDVNNGQNGFITHLVQNSFVACKQTLRMGSVTRVLVHMYKRKCHERLQMHSLL